LDLLFEARREELRSADSFVRDTRRPDHDSVPGGAGKIAAALHGAVIAADRSPQVKPDPDTTGKVSSANEPAKGA